MNQIAQYLDIGFLVLFLLIVVGLILAALRGFKRGVWKSTHNMVFMLSLIVIAFFTLGIMADFVGSFQISMFFKGSFTLSRTVDGNTVTYYVPITTVKETLEEFIKGFYAIYNVSISSAEATNIAFALATSLLKVVVFIIDMILILTLGNLFSFLSWYLIFRHFIPRVARKTIKIRWLGLIETVATFLITTVLFLMPFSSLVNSVNQSYQKNKQNMAANAGLVENVGQFIDAYDKSLFAKVLFNWTVDSSGMTFDTRLFDSWTKGTSGGYSVGIVGEIANIANTIAMCSSAINSEGSEIVFDYTSLITREIVDQAFESAMNSELIGSLLPIAVEIALNSDLLEGYIPTRLVNLSDVNWRDELGYVRDMVDCVFESGAIDRLFTVDETGKRVFRNFQGTDLFNFIEEIVTYDDAHFDHILDMFKSIDESKVLSRVVPALIKFAIDSDTTGVAKQYLPFTWEELNEFSWGYESYVLLDFLHSAIKLDDDFVKAIFIQTKVYEEDPNVKKLETLISEHADEFKNLMVGEFTWNTSSNKYEPKYADRLDNNGRTIVFDNNGNRQKDNNVNRHYCFFDMNLVNRTLPHILDNLFNLEALQDIRSTMTDDDVSLFHNAVVALDAGEPVLNYKSEFYSVLDVVSTAATDEELVAALFTGTGLTPLMEEENNYFSIDMSHINVFRNAVDKMDRSSVLYFALAPMLKNLLSQADLVTTFSQLGLDNTVVVSAIEHDIKASNHTLFSDFSDLLSHWGDLKNVFTLSSLTDTNELMDKLKTPAGESESPIVRSLIDILKMIHDNNLLNPTPQAGDTYEKNANLYGLLDYIFDMTGDTGLNISEATIKSIPDYKWNAEFESVGQILTYIADHDLLNAGEAFSSGFSRSALNDLRRGGTHDLPGLFEKIDSSILFSSSFGAFLDQLFGDALSGFIIDSPNHISFINVKDWSVEANNIGNLLDSYYHILPENDAEAQDLIANFDISKFTNVVDLNDMLHDLAHSGIFTYVDDNGDSHYQFGKWLYSKVEPSLSNFSDDNKDLIADPTFGSGSLVEWKESWGIRPEDSSVNADPYFAEWRENNSGATKTHYIAYRDFVHPNNIDDIVTENDHEIIDFWCDYDEFKSRQSSFLTAHGNDLTTTYTANDWHAYYGSDAFMNDYGAGEFNVFDVDEISRIVKFLTYSLRMTDMNNISSELLGNMLQAVNETYCFRICIYNFYEIAMDIGFDSTSGFSLESAYTTYMVDADYEMMDYDHARPARQQEFDKLVTLYDVINQMNDLHILDGDFKYDVLKDNGLVDDLKDAIKGLLDSEIFHRKGSAIANKLTAFQSIFNYLLDQGGVKDMIYLGNNSPKDQYYINQASPLYNSAESKVEYILKTIFLDDAGIADLIAHDPTINENERRLFQAGEIDKLFNVIDTLFTLEDSGGQPVSSFDDVDITSATNTETIVSLLNILNDSELLYDLVPNAIYKLFVENNSLSIDIGSGDPVDFGRIDPFYHYYYNLDNLQKLTAPNFEARYKPSTASDSDLKHLGTLLTDYQNFNEALNGGDMTDKTVLLSLIDTNYADGVFNPDGSLPILLKEMHDCHLFHTPARNYGSGYYTSKFDNGFTLFEDLMRQVCASIGLDTFAYEATYDQPNGFNSAAEKLAYNIKQTTRADDGLTSVCYYHNTEGNAWYDEITALMHLAYSACDMASGSTLDIGSFDMESLTASQVKTMLTCVNYSNIVADAVPNFVKTGFESMDLENLATYDATVYTNYRLGQVGYGGTDGASGIGTEIDNIYNVLTALRDEYGNFPDLSDINAFINADATGSRLIGLLRFIYESRILDTPVGGNYRDYNIVNGHQITAQGVLLFNVLDTGDLTDFIAHDALTTTASSGELDKIEQLSTIIHMPYDDADAIAGGLTYEIEAQGLSKLLKKTEEASINADTFSGSSYVDITSVESYKEPVLAIVSYAYDADGSGHRSAITSEFVSGLLNTILENEYEGLNEKVTNNGYAYNQFTFGKPSSASLISFAHYATLDEVERNGIEGVIDSLQYIEQLNDPLVLINSTSRKALADNIEMCFAKMTSLRGGQQVNSEMAKIVYLNNLHEAFEYFDGIDNSEYQYFIPVDETSTSTLPDSNTLYSSNFFMSEYGTRLKEYMYPGL